MEKSGGDRNHQAQPDSGLANDNAQLRDELKATLAELKGLQADFEHAASCKHPAESVREGVCGECGQDLWPAS